MAWQDAVPVEISLGEHVVEPNEPKLSEEKLIEPVGVVGVPALVSVTVTLHAVVPPTIVELGEQDKITEVVRTVALSANVDAVLPEWSVSEL